MALLILGETVKTREPLIEGPPDLPVGSYRAVLVAHSRVHGPSEPVEVRIRIVRAGLRPPIGGGIGRVTPVPPPAPVPTPAPIPVPVPAPSPVPPPIGRVVPVPPPIGRVAPVPPPPIGPVLPPRPPRPPRRPR